MRHKTSCIYLKVQKFDYFYLVRNISDPFAKRGLMEIAKCIDPGQPGQPTQADHGRNFSLFAVLLCIITIKR